MPKRQTHGGAGAVLGSHRHGEQIIMVFSDEMHKENQKTRLAPMQQRWRCQAQQGAGDPR